MTKKSFMIAHGASVVVIRDGKRKTVTAGSGTEFTEDEINSINRQIPGALRKPINEGGAEPEAETEDDSEKKPAKAPAKAKAKAPAKKAADKSGDDADKSDDDADEDEDI